MDLLARHARSPAAAALLTLAVAGAAAAQAAPLADTAAALPFASGETLTFAASIPRFGAEGTGIMRVERTDSGLLLLRFDFDARVAFADVSDRTRSWLDPTRMASLRYAKRERSPLGARTEEVRMSPATRGWSAGDGRAGVSPTGRPLDELSFLYFIRTLPLEPRAVYSFDRHYDAARNPVVVRVLGRETVEVPAGAFDAVVVEMEVRDAGRFGGDGRLRLYLTDDARRTPVRIETSMPLAGGVVLELTARSYADGRGASPP